MIMQGGTKRRRFCSPNAPIWRIPRRSYSRRALTIILSGWVCRAVQAMIGTSALARTAARANSQCCDNKHGFATTQFFRTRSIEALIFRSRRDRIANQVDIEEVVPRRIYRHAADASAMAVIGAHDAEGASVRDIARIADMRALCRCVDLCQRLAQERFPERAGRR